MWNLFVLLGCTQEKQDTGTEQQSQCTSEQVPQESFQLLPDVPLTQIHADVISDGTKIWMTYNLPNEENQFDVYLVSFGCDGSIQNSPKQIMNVPGLNQTTPRISFSQNRILVASQGDNSSAGNNLSIHLYIQDIQGNVIEEDLVWDPEIAAGNRWLPSIVGVENGFWIAAATANDSYFRTAVQALDIDGHPMGEAHWVGPDSYAVFPNIAAKDDNYIVGWESSDDSVQYVKGNMDGSFEEELQTLENQAGVKVLWNDDFDSVLTHQISPLRLLWNGEPLSDLSSTFYPNAAQGLETTLFSYFQLQSGYQNNLYYGFFGDNGQIGVDNLIASEPTVAPYRPAVTHVANDIFFVAWSQGENPDFELWGRFVTPTK
jgi:hypothetical protein